MRSSLQKAPRGHTISRRYAAGGCAHAQNTPCKTANIAASIAATRRQAACGARTSSCSRVVRAKSTAVVLPARLEQRSKPQEHQEATEAEHEQPSARVHDRSFCRESPQSGSNSVISAGVVMAVFGVFLPPPSGKFSSRGSAPHPAGAPAPDPGWGYRPRPPRESATLDVSNIPVGR